MLPIAEATNNERGITHFHCIRSRHANVLWPPHRKEGTYSSLATIDVMLEVLSF